MLKNEELKEEKTSIVDEKQKEKEFIEPEKTSKNRSSVFDQLQTPVEEVKENEIEGTIEDALGGSIDDDEDSSSLENNFEDLDEDNMDGLFEDHKLMAELGVEIIDMAFTYGCMAIANDKDEAQWTVSAARRNRLKKPLGLLLKNKEAKVKPEVMVLLIVLSVYAPMLYKAIKMKMAEAKIEATSRFESGRPIIYDVRPVETSEEAKRLLRLIRMEEGVGARAVYDFEAELIRLTATGEIDASGILDEGFSVQAYQVD